MRLTIPLRLLLLATICFCRISTAQADPLIAAAQQTLKDQGFYYGNVDGKENAETTAGIRRYQIRNGLKINGELNTETQRSLGVRADQPSGRKPISPPPSDRPIAPNRSAPSSHEKINSAPRPGPSRGDVAMPPREMNGTLDGTPYQGAAADLQHHVIANVQGMLVRRGYYRGPIDGVYGSGTEFAVRAYQARVGLAVNGHLDFETLTALGMLPGTHRFGPAPRRLPRQPPEPIYRGEWVPE